MDMRFDVYREILDDGADKMDQFAVDLAARLKLPDGYRLPLWGDCPRRVSIFSVRTSMAKYIYEYYKELSELTGSDTYASSDHTSMDTSLLTLWGNDLPTMDSDPCAGYRTPEERFNPRISLAERREGDRAFGNFSRNLVDVIESARSLAIDRAVRRGLPKVQSRFGKIGRLTSGCICPIPLLGINPEQRILSRTELISARADNDTLIPVVKLGPVQSTFEPDDFDARLRYGHITRG